jgi:hypothetical protein
MAVPQTADGDPLSLVLALAIWGVPVWLLW